MDRKKMLYRVSLHIVPFIFVWLLRLWFGTCRIRVHGGAHRDHCIGLAQPTVATFWHYTIFYVFFHMKKDSGVVMVSASKDGEYIARVAHKMGFETVRGSRNSRGLAAIKGLLKGLRSGKNAGIVADGSQGPARVVQPGSILLASQTGAPILPMLWSCSSYKVIRSWDRTVLPLPFSRIDFYYGEPLQVPGKLSPDQLEEYRLLLEERLNDLYSEAWKIHDKTEH